MVRPAFSSDGDETRVRDGGVKNIYLFVGEEGHLKEKEISALKGSVLDKNTIELNYIVFDGNDASAKDILSWLATMPFLSPRRLAVVRRAERLSEADKALIADYASKPKGTGCLILDSKDASFPPALFAQNKHLEVIRFDKIPLFKMSGWIRGIVRSHGKSIDDEALELVKELLGQKGHGVLEKEIEKLASFTGARKEINAGDVEEIVGRDLVRTTFDITDAIGARDTEKALGILRHIEASSSPRYGDIISLISWQLKTLLKSRLLLDRGRSLSEVAVSLKVPHRLKSSYMDQVKRHNSGEFYSKLEMLLNADLDIKRGRMEPKASLEAAIVRLCLG